MEKYDRLRAEEYINEWPRYSAQDLRRRESTIIAAKLALNAAMTAPVAGGVPQIDGHLVYGQEELEKVALKMEELAHTHERWKRRFLNEAVMVRESDVILFLGNFRAHETPLDAMCGMCGGSVGCAFFYEKRETRNGHVDITDKRSKSPIKGPLCSARLDDLGYVVGSAVWMAQSLLVDARPLMSVGMAGQKIGYCPKSAMVVGIPMSCLSKNPYQDIPIDYHLINMEKMIDNTRKNFVVNRQTGSGIHFDYRTQMPRLKKEEDNGKD